MKNKLKLFILALFSIILISNFAIATDISTCYDFTSSDYYFLTNDITQNYDCFTFMTTDYVSLDCQGFSITSDGTGRAVFIQDYGNVELKNCVFKNYAQAIYLLNTNNIIMENISVIDSVESCYKINNLDSAIISNNYLENCGSQNIALSDSGIFVAGGSTNITLLNTTIKDSTTGFYSEDSTLNIIKDNIIEGNINGIAFYSYISNKDNLFYNNIINNTRNFKTEGANANQTNYFNTTKTAGTNILGINQYIGGNYWSDYTGTSSDGDYIGDTAYDKSYLNDYLPLVLSETIIVNNAPDIYNINIVPSTAYTDSTLNCSAIYNDLDSDLGIVTIKWNNGTFTYSNTISSVPSGNLVSLELIYDITKGETWNCTINATDGSLNSNPNSTIRVVSNTAPTIDSIALNTPLTESIKPLCSFVASDIDLDSLDINFSWYLDNVYYSSSINTTTSGVETSSEIAEQTGGVNVTCIAFATDGTANTDSAIISGVVEIPVTPPTPTPSGLTCPSGNELCLALHGIGVGIGILFLYLLNNIAQFILILAISGVVVFLVIKLAQFLGNALPK